MMRRWQERARERAADFEIACWDGPYPDDDLDACLAVLRTLKTGESARLHTVSLRGKTVVVTLRINNEYWPTVEWLRNGLEWERRVVEPLNE